MKLGSLCSGYGGFELGLAPFGFDLAWLSEIDPHASQVLDARFDAPNLGDLTTADPEPVDVLCAGFPCQPVSQAGRRAGVHDEKWIFDDIADLVGRMDPRPRLCLFENVRGLLSANGGDAMARVVYRLADLGYVGRYRLLSAADVGACHRRQRVWIAAYADGMAGSLPESCRRRPRPVDEPGEVQRTERLRGVADTGLSLLPTPTASYPGGATRDGSKGGGTDTSPPSLGWTLNDVRHADRWAEYAPAISRHEAAFGRPPPDPTDDGRLSPRFVEWMMCLPEGWVTDLDLSRTQQLRILGNGIVSACATAAFADLLGIQVAAA